MRILQMMGGGDVGGAKTHIMTLIQALRERNEVMLISFRDGPFPREAEKNGIHVRVIPSFNPIYCRNEVRKIIAEFQPDVIHCHGGKANLVGALLRGRNFHIPVLTTVHSDYRYDYLGNPLKQWTNGFANTIALRFWTSIRRLQTVWRVPSFPAVSIRKKSLPFIMAWILEARWRA